VNEWPNTDFDNTSVTNWVQILSGGPPKDGIPALDSVTFTSVDAEGQLQPREPVITLEIEGEVPRAYPIRYSARCAILASRLTGEPTQAC